jgi:hypothetical protein
MIDVENQIITNVIEAFTGTKYEDIYISSDPARTPNTFPCVYIAQTDSYETRNTRPASREQLFETVVFECYVYSNKTSGAKMECKNVMTIIDESMRIQGFTRSTETPLMPSVDTVKAIRFSRYTANASTVKYTDSDTNKQRNMIYST